MIFRVNVPPENAAALMAVLEEEEEVTIRGDHRDEGHFFVEAPLRDGGTLATIAAEYDATVQIDEERSQAAISRARVTVREQPRTDGVLELVATIDLPGRQGWLESGSLVVIDSNPHHPGAAPIVGRVVSFLPGKGVLGSDAALVEYQDPRDGATHQLPFAPCHLRPGEPEWLLLAAQRYEALARELRALAERQS